MINIDILPTGNGRNCAFSSDGVYMAVAHNQAPYISIYKKSENGYIKLNNPSVLPTNHAISCAFSADNTYLAVTFIDSPYVFIYKRNGDIFTKLNNPSILPTGTAWDCTFSSDGLYLAIAHFTTPFISIYIRSGDVFTKIADPAVLPAVNAQGCSFSHDGIYLAVCSFNYPYIAVYKRVGSNFVKLDFSPDVPTGVALKLSFSHDDTYLAVAHSEFPYITIYKRNADAFSKLSNPAVLPSAGRACAFSPNDSILAVACTDSPFVMIYERIGDIFHKIQDSETLPAGAGNGCAFAPDTGALFIAHNNTPFITGYSSLPDPAPRPAKPIYPVFIYLEVDKDQEFLWQHIISTITPQTQADLQLSNNGGPWEALATVLGAETIAAIAADTIPAGKMRWRVRTYNTNGVAGEWSDPAAFIGIGTPPIPTISSLIACHRPVVNWQSIGQVAYQVQIGDYDTGEVEGIVKTYRLPYYIQNGEYQVRVRVKSASLQWSEWAEYTLTIAATGPSAPLLYAVANGEAAVLTFEATGAEYLYLLRNGVTVADVTGLTSYTDHAALGSVSYILRAVDASDNYTDSTPATSTVEVDYASLAAVDALSQPMTLMLTRGEPRRISGAIGQAATYRYYAGRKKPVAVFAGQKSEVYQVSFAFLQASDRDQLIALLDRCMTMLYRDNWGNRWFVTIPSTGYDQDSIATSMPLSMTVVDYVEAIQYAEV